MKKVLVLGGNGFIGKNIVEHIDKNKNRITVFDTSDLVEKISNVEYIIGNINEIDKLDLALKGKDVVINLANSVLPNNSMKYPEQWYEKEIKNLLMVLDSCKRNNVNRVIFASSGGMIYGDNNESFNSEESPKQPISHYGIVKMALENILIMHNKMFNMENIILRIANPYGIGQDSKSGVGVITNFIEKMLNNDKISIYGDGEIVKDFIAIKDVVQAFQGAIDYKIDNSISPIFNIGSGQGRSINEIVNILQNNIETESKVEYLPKRCFDTEKCILDISKAKKYLGYCPNRNLEVDIKKYICEVREG